MAKLKKNEYSYSMTYRVTDINYEISEESVQEGYLLAWQKLLNGFDSDALLQIMLFNRTLSKETVERLTQIPLKEDGLNLYRKEFNTLLRRKLEVGNKNKVIQEKYLTVSVKKKDTQEAEAYFDRILGELQSNMRSMSESAEVIPLNKEARVRLLHDIYRQGEEDNFIYKPEEQKKGFLGVKEYFAPKRYEFDKVKEDSFTVGEKVARSMVFIDYASFLDDRFIKRLMDLPKNMIITITLAPVPKHEALKRCDDILTGLATEAAKYNKNQSKNQNYGAELPPKMQDERNAVEEFRDDIRNRDQGVFFMTLALCHFADDMQELNRDTDSLISTTQQHHCQLITNRLLQEDTFNHIMPFGLSFIENWRGMTSEGVAAFNPFCSIEMMQEGGSWFGDNIISGNLIVGNRDMLKSASALVFGRTGSGKSFFVKEDMVQYRLRYTDADFIIIDPEREFGSLCAAFGGSNIILSAGSSHHINPMDIVTEDLDSEDSPVALKTEFLLSLFEQLLSSGSIGDRERSIIDRCVRLTYRDVKKPTLVDFYEILKKQPEILAEDIALGLERFIEGGQNVFAHHTNVDMDNKFLVFDLYDLGSGMKDAAMSIMLDAVFRKVAQNRKIGRDTYIVIDEYWVMLKHAYSAEYMEAMWRRFRKYGAKTTGITQNISDVSGNEKGLVMLNNTEIVVMLDQQAGDIEVLKHMVGLTSAQSRYIIGAPVGQGLIKFGDDVIPFINKFDKDTELYRLLTTNPKELKAYAQG